MRCVLPCLVVSANVSPFLVQKVFFTVVLGLFPFLGTNVQARCHKRDRDNSPKTNHWVGFDGNCSVVFGCQTMINTPSVRPVSFSSCRSSSPLVRHDILINVD